MEGLTEEFLKQGNILLWKSHIGFDAVNHSLKSEGVSVWSSVGLIRCCGFMVDICVKSEVQSSRRGRRV